MLTQSLQDMTPSNTNPLYRRQLEKSSRWSPPSPPTWPSHLLTTGWYCKWQMWHCTVLHPPALTEPPSLATIGSTVFLLFRSTPPTRTDSTWDLPGDYIAAEDPLLHIWSLFFFSCVRHCVFGIGYFSSFFYFRLWVVRFGWSKHHLFFFLFVAWLGTRQ